MNKDTEKLLTTTAFTLRVVLQEGGGLSSTMRDLMVKKMSEALKPFEPKITKST